jgi:hypothetical protein
MGERLQGHAEASRSRTRLGSGESIRRRACIWTDNDFVELVAPLPAAARLTIGDDRNARCHLLAPPQSLIPGVAIACPTTRPRRSSISHCLRPLQTIRSSAEAGIVLLLVRCSRRFSVLSVCSQGLSPIVYKSVLLWRTSQDTLLTCRQHSQWPHQTRRMAMLPLSSDTGTISLLTGMLSLEYVTAPAFRLSLDLMVSFLGGEHGLLCS